ncbi:MAG: DUF362 domain-containing protein [Sedimentisphaerales bacterium]|nr:DUF362 domain-containing protein [Sedimentisphaerales bacterium]
MTEPNQINPARRQLLVRGAKAAASIAAAGTVAYWLYDREGPKGEAEARRGGVTLPDFSVPRKDGQTLSIVQGEDRVKTVNKAIELLGGIERFIAPGDVVVIKPNVAFASPPLLGATTHPDVVAAVVRLCYDKGRARKVIVIDNPINDPASCFTISGVGKAATAAGAQVLMPKESLFSHTTLVGGSLIKDWPVYYGPFAKANKLIGIAPVKDHHRSVASMSMKNWYGLLGGRRNIFHQDINTIIAELAMMVKPTFVILDGTVTMMTNGPTGGSVSDLKKTNTMIASCDMVAADAFGCSLLNLKPSDLPYLSLAEKAGVGTVDYVPLKPLRANVS